MGPMIVKGEQRQPYDISIEVGRSRYILGPQANDGKMIRRE
jgi:hypothetical protein